MSNDRPDATLDKLSTEVDHLERLLDTDADSLSADQVLLALSISKRVRRESKLLVRHLASLRDQLRP